MRIDAIELGGLDQRVGDGGRFTASFGTGEELVLALDRNAAHGVFCTIVVQFEDAVVDIGPQPPETHDGVADRAGERGFTEYLGKLSMEPGFEIVEDRLGFRLPDTRLFIRRPAPRLFLDRV